MSKRGDAYLRTLLIHGARSAILAAQHKPDMNVVEDVVAAYLELRARPEEIFLDGFGRSAPNDREISAGKSGRGLRENAKRTSAVRRLPDYVN